MAKSEEGLKSLLLKVKEESEKADLKLNIQETQIMASGPIISRQIDGETVEIVTDFIFLVFKSTVDPDSSHEIKSPSLRKRKGIASWVSIQQLWCSKEKILKTEFNKTLSYKEF